MAEFKIVDATIGDIHAAYQDGTLTARQLVETYLDRIERYDRNGPTINSVISVNPKALDEADRLDAAFKARGLTGPLHGIPLMMKDQGDVAEMPTTLGSILFEGHMPGRDAFVVAKLKAAGAIFIGKATLGELGAGDTHGSLFGSTKNVYDLDRTAGGSSGGSGEIGGAVWIESSSSPDGTTVSRDTGHDDRQMTTMMMPSSEQRTRASTALLMQ